MLEAKQVKFDMLYFATVLYLLLYYVNTKKDTPAIGHVSAGPQLGGSREVSTNVTLFGFLCQCCKTHYMEINTLAKFRVHCAKYL